MMLEQGFLFGNRLPNMHGALHGGVLQCGARHCPARLGQARQGKGFTYSPSPRFWVMTNAGALVCGSSLSCADWPGDAQCCRARPGPSRSGNARASRSADRHRNMAICGTKANGARPSWAVRGFARLCRAWQGMARQGLHAPAMVLVERSIAGTKASMMTLQC